MKTKTRCSRHSSRPITLARRLRSSRRGFTLVELLVVISIIGILAAFLLPVLVRAKRSAQIQKARIEMSQIIQAVGQYEAAYSRLPVSTQAMNAAGAKNEDFTYGTSGVVNNKIMDVASGAPVVASILATDGSGNPLTYQANNSEVMAILMDKEYFPSPPAAANTPTVNQGHVKNPQKNPFLSATVVSEPLSLAAGAAVLPGIGSDLVDRDQWKNPYIISFDLNNDEKTRDWMYRKRAVSQQQANGQVGYFGLVNSQPNPPGPNSDYFEAAGHVMVWSAGPDMRIHSGLAANQGANKDNVLSWKP